VDNSRQTSKSIFATDSLAAELGPTEANLINEHIDSFAGLPIFEFDPAGAPPEDPSAVAIRLSTEFEENERFQTKWDALFAADWVGQIRALVIGEWGDAYESSVPVESLVGGAAAMPGLRALFLGELIGEESEISWIQLTDVTPVLHAFPGLEVLRVRGSDGLDFVPGSYPGLRELAFESGGLPAGIVRAVGESDLPNVRHLELWLGTDTYGGDATLADLAPILAGANTPSLAYLGLRDSEIADEVAAAVAGASVVGRLETLDLSLGMLSDVGAAALLSGQPLTHLRKLDLHHHFLTAEMMQRVRDELEPAGVEVDLSDANLDARRPEDRFIAVAE
jgi:hypothetical protein